tara:strand:- start:1 stop:621 length:621 start_codon:yes stop_codon:yes gene_type:complete
MSTRVKAKYLSLFLSINLLIYFLIQNHVTRNEYDLMTELDHAIPFMPEYIWVYHSIVPVIGGATLLLLKSRKAFFTTLWSFILATVALNFFYLYFPSFYPRGEFEPITISEIVVEVTRKIDGANNTFPSGHVCFAWLMYWGMFFSEAAEKLRGLRSLFCLWAIGISLSTLVLKQHYIIDVGSGFLLATMSFFLVKSVIENCKLYEE